MAASIPSTKISIICVGAGGTASRFIRDFAGLMYQSALVGFKPIKFTIIDHDIVEEKNVGKQAFHPSDVGLYKAEVLSERYSSYGNFKIGYDITKVEDANTLYKRFMKDAKEGYLPVLIGCVDNLKARQIFHTVFSKFKQAFIWIDSGNERFSGQIVFGLKGNHGSLIFPPVTHLFPDMLTMKDKPQRTSCADALDLRKAEQFAMANAQAASILFQFMTQIVLELPINTAFVNFDCSNIQVKPEFVNYNQMAVAQ